MSDSRASNSNHQDSWNGRESETASDGAELDEMLAASDPASCWEQDDEADLNDAYDDENSPAHWIQEWAENKERDMHRAAEMAYSVFSESACCTGTNHSMGTSLLMGLGFALCVGVSGLGVSDAAVAAEVAAGHPDIGNMAAILADEPANALSLPTWVIHVASVVEWITAISLVWRYGDSEEPGRRAWKGLAWGMLPLLAGALCACTWHFFYNAPSLEGIVALQGFFTVLGNCTLWWAAFRIYQQAQKPAAS
jgi:hypothetical protein